VRAREELRAFQRNGQRPPAEGEIIWAAGVSPKPVRWLIADRVPLGAPTMVGGEPGLGKSALTALYAAEGSLGAHGEPFVTLFASAEDSRERIIVPRLLALGADLERVGFFAIRDECGSRDLTFPDDMRLLEAAIVESGARMVVVDPLNAFLGGDVDSHKDQSIRRVLAPLARVAQERDVAIVCVAHTRKEKGGPAVYRLGGSVGYGGAARSVLGFGRDPEDPDGELGHRRLLGHVKCNYGPLAPTLIYRHEAVDVLAGDDIIATHRLVLVGESDVAPGDVFDGPRKDDRGADAEEAIAERLAGGLRKSREVKSEVAQELGAARKPWNGPRCVSRVAVSLLSRRAVTHERPAGRSPLTVRTRPVGTHQCPRVSLLSKTAWECQI
jgi:hypothetical protein